MVLPNQKQGHHVFYCINKAVSRGDSLVSDLIIALQNYVDAFNIQRSERAGNDGRSLRAEVVSIEDDVVAVLIFESLLGLKCLAENVCGDEVGSECAYCICEVGVEVDLVTFFAHVDIDFGLIVHEEVLLFAEALRASKISVAFDPDWKVAEVSLCDLHHVRRVTFEVELLDPVLVEGIVVPDVGAYDAFFLPDLAVVEAGDEGLLRMLLEKDVVIESVIAVEDRHEAHDFCSVRHMVRCVAPVGAFAYGCECAADEVMYHGDALCCDAECSVRQENIVVDQCRTMTYLYEDILAAHAALERCSVFRTLVVVKEILCDAGTLCFPVCPDAHDAVMDVVSSHDDVDSCVELDAGNFCAAQFHHVVDVVNVVVFDDRENSAHTADDAALLAVVDVVAAYDVAADILLEPAVVLASADCVTLHLRGALKMLICEVVVVLRIQILTEADAGALGEVDFIVFDDPAL